MADPELRRAVDRLTRVHIGGEKHRDVYPPNGYQGPTLEDDWQLVLLDIAAKLERPAVEANITHYGDGWEIERHNHIPTTEVAAMLGVEPVDGMIVKVTIEPA